MTPLQELAELAASGPTYGMIEDAVNAIRERRAHEAEMARDRAEALRRSMRHPSWTWPHTSREQAARYYGSVRDARAFTKHQMMINAAIAQGGLV